MMNEFGISDIYLVTDVSEKLCQFLLIFIKNFIKIHPCQLNGKIVDHETLKLP
jgi:hypothetical protein